MIATLITSTVALLVAAITAWATVATVVKKIERERAAAAEAIETRREAAAREAPPPPPIPRARTATQPRLRAVSSPILDSSTTTDPGRPAALPEPPR